MSNKYTDGLLGVLEQSPENVEVIIELESPVASSPVNLPRNEAIEQSKMAFQRIAQPVQAVIENEGGDVLGSAWLNNTIQAKVKADCLDHLAALHEVSAIDVPRRIGRSAY